MDYYSKMISDAVKTALLHEEGLDALRRYSSHPAARRSATPVGIGRVLFNPPATVVFWNDGVKTVVKAQNGEPFDREKGLAMAICKRMHGNRGGYFDAFKYWCHGGETEVQGDESEG